MLHDVHPTSDPSRPAAPPRQVEPERLDAFLGKMVGDMGAALTAALVIVGDQLGLYKAMAELDACTPAELASHTRTSERYVREWLAAQAAAGYCDYDRDSRRFALNPEQAMVFAEEGGPAFLVGAFELVQAMFRDEAKITQAFHTGAGVGWHEHDACLFRGAERFFRPGYNAYLVDAWIPALKGVDAKLKAGAAVADIGCGHGASTIIMAQAYPKSRFFGFDYHPASIERAREAARQAGVDDRVEFAVAAAKDFHGHFDLICVFDALHDMGDPVGAARHIRDRLDADGTWMLVEPFANDCLADNLNPVGRMYYAASTMFCTPASLSQEVGLGLGAQAGEARMRAVCEEAGFGHFRRAAETPFNLVYEVRP